MKNNSKWVKNYFTLANGEGFNHVAILQLFLEEKKLTEVIWEEDIACG